VRNTATRFRAKAESKSFVDLFLVDDFDPQM